LHGNVLTSPSPAARTTAPRSGRTRLTVARVAAARVAAPVLGFFVITLDATVVNVALPTIRAELGGGMAGLQWVADGYTLLFAALLLSAGALTDRLGARRAFGAGLVGFVLASVACGLAPDLGALVAARFAQGAAAAVMMPSSMALLGQAFPDARRRARAVAAYSMGGAVAATSGPVVGGLLTLVDWRLIFLINVPAGALALLALARAPRGEAPAASGAPAGRVPLERRPFDWAGQATATLAMAGITFGAIEAGSAGVGSPAVVLAFAVGTTAALAFALIQRRSRHPMIPRALARNRTMGVTAASGFAFMVGYFGLPFVMSLSLQQAHGLSALETGLAFLPMMLAGLAMTPFSARLLERFGARRLLGTGLVALAAGLTLVGTLSAVLPVWATSGLMLLVGLSGPLIMPPSTASLLGGVPAGLAGTASGVFNTSRQVGGALSVAVFGGLLAGPAGLQSGVLASLLLAAGVALLAALASRGLPVRPTSSPTDPKERNQP
jgi:EmrB/QacA subfamily drug resistance transporter